MKRNQKSMVRRLLLSGLLLAGMCAGVIAQTTPSPGATEPVQAPTQDPQANPFANLRLLNLTQDQIRMIRLINSELKDERQAAILRRDKAQRALDEAIDVPVPDESLIAQRSRELAEAQATTIRLRSLTEARILQVLTPEQRKRIREIRIRNQEMQAVRQGQRANPTGQRQGLQGGANNPVITPAQRRALRRQTRP